MNEMVCASTHLVHVLLDQEHIAKAEAMGKNKKQIKEKLL